MKEMEISILEPQMSDLEGLREGVQPVFLKI